jgi:hypothetical protein
MSIKTVCLGILGTACGIAGGGIFNYNPLLTALSGIISGIALPIMFRPLPQPPPVTFLSKIDHETLITENNWAVTLIQNGGLFNEHAELVIEGVKAGIPSLHFAHLIGGSNLFDIFYHKKRGTVKYDKIQYPYKIEYTRRSQVFKCSYEIVQKMIAEIKKEKKMGSYSLNLCGRHSFLAKEGQDSCITWALEKLKILGIYFKSTILSKIATFTSDFTQPKSYYEPIIPNLNRPNCKLS